MKDIMEFLKIKPSLLIGAALASVVISITLFSVSCNQDACEYIVPGGNPVGCAASDTLNLSTGIDTAGAVIPPGAGVVDPFWQLINNPPLVNCSDPLVSSINGSAYVVNYSNAGPSGWVNQPGSSTLAPVNLGTTQSFFCNNATNSNGIAVPYIFERSFCVLKNTSVNFNFTYKGDDQLRLELIDNVTGSVLSASLNYIWSAPAQTWTAAALPLPAGSYSIRAYLINTVNVVTGFSMAGNLTTSNGDLAISNNAAGCCENNTISVLNILEEVCDGMFNGNDQVGSGWTINLKDSGGNIIRTAVTDINGNVFFAGLPDGNYTVEIVPQGGWVPTVASFPVSLTNNEVEIVEFYNCK